MKYREDIQILRGISVVFVVLFHFGFEVFESGFLGVDVFFVLSGFLMAVLYEDEKKLEFLKRRARRLLPSYFIVVAAVLFVSFIINTPNETSQIVSQVQFASAFVPNVGYWLQNSYFSKSEFNPLLHLWSLGVEIQFYVCVPLLAFLIKKSKLFFISMLLASMVFCLVIVGISPKTAFFLLPTRVWEFLLGFGSALFFTQNGAAKVLWSQGWLQNIPLLFLLCIPLLPIDGQSTNLIYGHPSLSAITVSVFTCLVLIFGMDESITNSRAGRIFEILGKYSYAIYLVHFPVIVLYLSVPFEGTNLNVTGVHDYLYVGLIIVVLTLALHHMVEVRFKSVRLRYILFVFPISILGFAFILTSLEKRYTSISHQFIFGALSDRAQYRCGKLIRVLDPTLRSCKLTDLDESVAGSVMLVGDSHADSIKSSFAKVAQENNINLHFSVSNSPLLHDKLGPDEIIREANRLNVQALFLHYSPKADIVDQVTELVDLAEIENIHVYFIDPVPVWDVHIPQALYFNYIGEVKLPIQTLADYRLQNTQLFDALDIVTNSNFYRINVGSVFCSPGCELISIDGRPLYFDSGHLTLTGASLLEDILADSVSKTIE